MAHIRTQNRSIDPMLISMKHVRTFSDTQLDHAHTCVCVCVCMCVCRVRVPCACAVCVCWCACRVRTLCLVFITPHLSAYSHAKSPSTAQQAQAPLCSLMDSILLCPREAQSKLFILNSIRLIVVYLRWGSWSLHGRSLRRRICIVLKL